FFSSRRRHTRFSRDWSSDVCSSDLLHHYHHYLHHHLPLLLFLLLPLLPYPFIPLLFPLRLPLLHFLTHTMTLFPFLKLARKLVRSEERRVGKECRSRWWGRPARRDR